MSGKIVFFYTLASPPSRACLLLFKLLKLQVELKNVNTLESEHRSEWFKKINPAMKIPVLVDHDFILTESRAIMTYLVSKYAENKFYATDVKTRAQIDEKLYYDGTIVFPQLQRMVKF
jgi:glutathione S-transferase